MRAYDRATRDLAKDARRWLVTGVGGFIGSNILEKLLQLDQYVVGLDNFATGKRSNLADVRSLVTPEQWGRFKMVEADIAGPTEPLAEACAGVDYVLHQAALGSIPRSIADPASTHRTNVTGFLNMLNAVQAANVTRFVYASSSSVYGDNEELPKIETKVGRPLSPYAATKAMDEMYADVFGRVYGLSSVGLRYFNVFGPRQDPSGPYAAVFPQWAKAMVSNAPAAINGDGSTSRDFCFVANVVQANLLAATVSLASKHEVFNVALNARTSLNELFELMRASLRTRHAHLAQYRPIYRPARVGDIRHSQANIEKAKSLLGYEPAVPVQEGVTLTLQWYEQRNSAPEH